MSLAQQRFARNAGERFRPRDENFILIALFTVIQLNKTACSLGSLSEYLKTGADQDFS